MKRCWLVLVFVAGLSGCKEAERPDPFALPLSDAEVAQQVELGRQLYTAQSCDACHSIDGTRRVGPTFLGLHGREVLLSDGSRVVADYRYLRRSIRNPDVDIVAGYTPGMSAYPHLPGPSVDALLFFIRSLEIKGKATPEEEAAATQPASDAPPATGAAGS